ncbi:MAG: transposase [Pirellula sp.]
MPRSVVERWLNEQRDWLDRNGLRGMTIEDARVSKEMPENLRRSFLIMRREGWQSHLDDCHGDCLLRRPEFAKIVADSLLKFDGERYDCERFVVMPNHVHALIQMRDGWDLREQCAGLMRFTGRSIHSMLHRKGALWQAEPFDHVLRSVEQFQYLRKYIVDNPVKCHLKDDEYLLWIRNRGFVLASVARLSEP